jgi:hypothetical protein
MVHKCWGNGTIGALNGDTHARVCPQVLEQVLAVVPGWRDAYLEARARRLRCCVAAAKAAEATAPVEAAAVLRACVVELSTAEVGVWGRSRAVCFAWPLPSSAAAPASSPPAPGRALGRHQLPQTGQQLHSLSRSHTHTGVGASGRR